MAPYKRRRHARKRMSKRRRHARSARFKRAVNNALQTYPWNMSIAHDTGLLTASLNTQNMAIIGTVGALNKVTGDSAVPNSVTYSTISTRANLIVPYQTAYTVATDTNVNVNFATRKTYFKYQKARFMFTNSSDAVAYLEIYHLYHRYQYDASNPNTMQLTATSVGPIQDRSGAATNITDLVPGVTPYDLELCTKSCYIRRVGVKRLEPGANALHILRTHMGHTFSPEDRLTNIDVCYQPKLTIHCLCRVWGEMVSGTGSPVMAPVNIVWGCIYRTKYKTVTDPIYGGITRETAETTMSIGTGGKVVIEANPATTAVTGAPVATV